jgi:hypothetical protein
MKEIDFIPQWYKAGRERKQRVSSVISAGTF